MVTSQVLGVCAKKSVINGRRKGDTMNPTPWCLPSGVLEWRISHPDLQKLWLESALVSWIAKR